MHRCVALALVCGGVAFACGGSNSSDLADDAGAAADVGPPPTDGGANVPDASVRGGRDDAGSDASAGIDASGSIKVKWAKACWEVQNGKRYQAIHFDLVTPAPATLKGTLFLATKCDTSQGTDANDNVATIPSGSYAYWFTNHADDTSTSATWSIAEETTGCVDYQHAPDCH
jgi:hypothetical protein